MCVIKTLTIGAESQVSNKFVSVHQPVQEMKFGESLNANGCGIVAGDEKAAILAGGHFASPDVTKFDLFFVVQTPLHNFGILAKEDDSISVGLPLNLFRSAQGVVRAASITTPLRLLILSRCEIPDRRSFSSPGNGNLCQVEAECHGPGTTRKPLLHILSEILLFCFQVSQSQRILEQSSRPISNSEFLPRTIAIA